MKRETYRAALYCRISRDDGDKQESDSIVTQKKMLEDYCARDPKLTVAAVYTDDGFTGTNFRRPGFERMLADIDGGRIDCVVVKDLSRFGRDYIDIGYYLERYFPEKGVRFLAVNDGVDSARGAYDMMLPLKNIFNAMYARDVSDKVRRSFRARQRRGEFVGAFAPYGYRKDPENRNRFLIDPEAAKTVREIFDRKAGGESLRAIARTLNRSGVLSPIEYKRSRGVALSIRQRGSGMCLWSDSAVGRILNNEVYLGCMVSNRFPSDEMHGRTRAAPRSEWIVVPETHEPIITKELWERAQRQMAAPRTESGRRTPPETSLFKGLIRCGDCGRAMVRRGGSYCCGTNKRYGGEVCARHAVSEAFLSEVVLSDLNRVIAGARDVAGLVKRSACTGKTPQNQARADAARARLTRQKQAYYEDYRAGRITRETYLLRRESCERQESGLAARAAEDATAQAAHADAAPWAEQFSAERRLTRLDRKTVEQAVREILVFADRRIEIRYLFAETANGFP